MISLVFPLVFPLVFFVFFVGSPPIVKDRASRMCLVPVTGRNVMGPTRSHGPFPRLVSRTIQNPLVPGTGIFAHYAEPRHTSKSAGQQGTSPSPRTRTLSLSSRCSLISPSLAAPPLAPPPSRVSPLSICLLHPSPARLHLPPIVSL